MRYRAAGLQAPIHHNIKQALVDGDETSTALVMRSVKNTERVYRNKTSDEVLRIEAEDPGNFAAIAHLVKVHRPTLPPFLRRSRSPPCSSHQNPAHWWLMAPYSQYS